MAAEIPAVPTLIQRHIFGLKSDVRNHLHYLEDHVVVYSAGHCVVVYNLETKQQRFIHGSNLHGPQGRTEIVAMDVSPNKRYIAISERSERAQVLIYDARTLKRRKTLTTSDCVSREYVCVAFSPDSKSILTLGGGPDNVLINWQWQKSKPIHMVKLDGDAVVTQCSFCPGDPTLMALTGRNFLKFCRMEPESSLLQVVDANLRGQKEEDYVGHVWAR